MHAIVHADTAATAANETNSWRDLGIFVFIHRMRCCLSVQIEFLFAQNKEWKERAGKANQNIDGGIGFLLDCLVEDRHFRTLSRVL